MLPFHKRTELVYLILPSKAKKLELLAAAHGDNGHMGGRDAVEKTLRTQAVNWQHLRCDAAWVVARCTQCVTRKTSGIAAPGCRSLPRPLCAGDVVGVDLKMVTPPGGDRWCMMVLLDFTSNRLWAWDMDEDKLLSLTLRLRWGSGYLLKLFGRWGTRQASPRFQAHSPLLNNVFAQEGRRRCAKLAGSLVQQD